MTCKHHWDTVRSNNQIQIYRDTLKLILDLCSTTTNCSEITIISDDNNSSSEMQKRIVSVKKQQNSDTPAKQCYGYQLHFPSGQQAHTSYPFALHTILPLTWDYSSSCKGFFLITQLYTGIPGRNG
jgi:hypothetical protein